MTTLGLIASPCFVVIPWLNHGIHSLTEPNTEASIVE